MTMHVDYIKTLEENYLQLKQFINFLELIFVVDLVVDESAVLYNKMSSVLVGVLLSSLHHVNRFLLMNSLFFSPPSLGSDRQINNSDKNNLSREMFCGKGRKLGKNQYSNKYKTFPFSRFYVGKRPKSFPRDDETSRTAKKRFNRC